MLPSPAQPLPCLYLATDILAHHLTSWLHLGAAAPSLQDCLKIVSLAGAWPPSLGQGHRALVARLPPGRLYYCVRTNLILVAGSPCMSGVSWACNRHEVFRADAFTSSPRSLLHILQHWLGEMNFVFFAQHEALQGGHEAIPVILANQCSRAPGNQAVIIPSWNREAQHHTALPIKSSSTFPSSPPRADL